MKLKVEGSGFKKSICKYINFDEEYIFAKTTSGGFAKYYIKDVNVKQSELNDDLIIFSFIVETYIGPFYQMMYEDSGIVLRELKKTNESTKTAFYAFPVKEEEKRIHNIFAIVNIKNVIKFESRYTSFNKITLAPTIESIYDYTVYEKDYTDEDYLNSSWSVYSMQTEPLFINGYSYDTKTVVVEKNGSPCQEIIFVKDNFNIVMDILKELKERASIDIHSSYPTRSMIKETKEKENMSTVMVDSKEYSETYRLANLYKKEHEVKNLLKNTGISIEFKPGKISYNPDIKDIKFNGPATIVFWNDGSKTVVKKGSGETTDDRKKAIIMAFLKKNKEDYKIIENTFNSEDPELALAISLLKRKGYSKDMLNKIYNKYKPKEEVKPKRKNTGKKEKTNGGSVKKRNKKS